MRHDHNSAYMHRLGATKIAYMTLQDIRGICYISIIQEVIETDSFSSINSLLDISNALPSK